MPKYDWPKMTDRQVLGKRISRIDGNDKVTGKAKYNSDVNLPGMLYAKFLRCPFPHARVTSIDISGAEQIPGVKAVKVIQGPGKEIHWALDDIAVVAAVDEATAEDAIRQIKVQYKKLPHLVNEDDPQKAGNRLKEPSQQTKGNPDQAFLEADSDKPVILSFTHHDYKDMRPDIESVRKMLINAKEKFPKVKFKYSEARNAVREALAINYEPAIKLNLNIKENKLFVNSSVPTFGPQPFLAIKTNSGEYLYDNFDFQVPFKEWTYTFDQQTIILKNIESIGVGCCDNAGNVSVVIIDCPGTSNEKIRRNNL